MKEFLHYENIEAYAEGRIDPPSVRKFEELLHKDPLLQKEYQLYLQSLKVAELFALKELNISFNECILTESVNGRVNSITKQAFGRRVTIRKFLSLAASVLILIISSLSWWVNTQLSNTQLINDNYLEPNFSTLRGNHPQKQNMQIAINFYYLGEYDKAQTLLQNELSNIDTLNPYWLLLGHVYLKNNQPQKAVAIFQKICTYKLPQTEANARWHLALAYLQMDEIKLANQVIEKILSEPQNSYDKKAMELKRKISSPWRMLCW